MNVQKILKNLLPCHALSIALFSAIAMCFLARSREGGELRDVMEGTVGQWHIATVAMGQSDSITMSEQSEDKEKDSNHSSEVEEKGHVTSVLLRSFCHLSTVLVSVGWQLLYITITTFFRHLQKHLSSEQWVAPVYNVTNQIMYCAHASYVKYVTSFQVRPTICSVSYL